MLNQFEQQRRALHDHVDLAFRASTMNEFSKTMEIAHGWIHGIIGGGWLPGTFQGHMWPLEYSAYEPLFMLHHTCVLLCIAHYNNIRFCSFANRVQQRRPSLLHVPNRPSRAHAQPRKRWK
jgi:hypothetical protein